VGGVGGVCKKGERGKREGGRGERREAQGVDHDRTTYFEYTLLLFNPLRAAHYIAAAFIRCLALSLSAGTPMPFS